MRWPLSTSVTLVLRGERRARRRRGPSGLRRSACPVRRDISPGCGVSTRQRRPAVEACPTSASASSTIGPAKASQRARTSAAIPCGPGPGRSRSRSCPSASIASDRVRSSGAVISSGACAAICGNARSADATVTRPAPARSAPSRHRRRAGLAARSRRPPARARRCPCVPRAAAARAVRGTSPARPARAGHRRRTASAGLPIAPTTSSPTWSQFGGSACATLGAVKVTV